MKRTKKQKVKAMRARVNSHLSYSFTKPYNLGSKNKDAKITENIGNLASIKKELYKSLFVATLIISSLIVIYWFT